MKYTKESISEVLRQILAKILDTQPESLNEHLLLLGEANWDSLSQMELILTVEEKFGIEFPIDRLSKIRTISDIEDTINGTLQGN